MQHKILIIAAFFTSIFMQAQNLHTKKIPSVILNNFILKYPKAKHVEWEMKGANYLVEFNTKQSKDQEVLYTPTGDFLKHKENISKKELPDQVIDVVNTSFKEYSVHNAERISTNNGVTYKIDLHSIKKSDWEIITNKRGIILSKNRD